MDIDRCMGCVGVVQSRRDAHWQFVTLRRQLGQNILDFSIPLGEVERRNEVREAKCTAEYIGGAVKIRKKSDHISNKARVSKVQNQNWKLDSYQHVGEASVFMHIFDIYPFIVPQQDYYSFGQNNYFAVLYCTAAIIFFQAYSMRI